MSFCSEKEKRDRKTIEYFFYIGKKVIQAHQVGAQPIYIIEIVIVVVVFVALGNYGIFNVLHFNL